MRVASLLLLSFLPLTAQQPFSRGVNEYSNTLAPYVPSPQQIVDVMLELAALKPNDTLYDLGCGDGRILITAAQRYHAKAVGVELSEQLFNSTTESVRRLNLQDQIHIVHANLLEVNLAPADVVTIYLETGANEQLRPNLEKYLRPGTRVVSHDFAVRGWKTAWVEKVDAYKRPHTIYLYKMPQHKK